MKNLKQSLLLVLADALLGAGELLKSHFSYSAKKETKEPETVKDPNDVAPLENHDWPGPATAPPETNTPPAMTPPAESPSDENGVQYDAGMCAKAKVPFYGSGARKGQWKKRKGVTDEQYDAWYVAAKLAAPPVDMTAEIVDPPAGSIAAGHFGPPAATEPVTPETLGEFMAWIAEQQTAGKVTPELVNAAYVETHVTFADVSDPLKAKGSVFLLWNYLNEKIK